MNVVAVTLPSVTISEFRDRDLIARNHGIQMRYSNIPVSGQHPYYSLPSDYLNNQLKSYGGSIRYEVEYVGSGPPTYSPDIIMTGNKQTLLYTHPKRLQANIRNNVEAYITPGNWKTVDGQRATRQQIMLTLANIDHLLIKLQYINSVQREVELLKIVMDSAGTTDRGLGSASLVEQCRCPNGYTGLSCEVIFLNKILMKYL